MWIDFFCTLFSSINKSLQLCFRLFWKWREMNTPPSRAGSKLIWRKAKGCFARWQKLLHREEEMAGAAPCCRTKDCSPCNTKRKDIHFYLCHISMSVWTFIRHGFLRSYCSERKQNTFSCETSFLSVQIIKRWKRKGVWEWEKDISNKLWDKDEGKKVSAYKKRSNLINNVNEEKK